MTDPIFGYHTVHELSDLWAAYGFELDRLQGAAERAALQWHDVDPAGHDAYIAEYNDARTRFEGYRDQVDAMLAENGPDTTPTWDHVFVVTLAGDLFDKVVADVGPHIAEADRIFRKAPPQIRALAPSYDGMPQPTAPDLSLDAYKLTDTATKAIEKGVGFAFSGVTLVLVGVLAGIVLVKRFGK